MKFRFLLLGIIMLLLSSYIAQAISFPNSQIRESLTEFEWCFDNPFDENKPVKTNEFDLYIDNLGCQVDNMKLEVLVPTTENYEVCDDPVNSCSPSGKTYMNGTQIYECVVIPGACTTKQKTVIERYDLKSTDYMLPKNSRVCLSANRKAKIGYQACDMNFNYDDGLTKFRAVDYGFQWWNVTYGKKLPINLSAVVGNVTDKTTQVKIILNSSLINYTDTDNDGDDIRFTNGTEDGELPYFICDGCWNETGSSLVYVNVSVSNSSVTSIFMYYNASVSAASNFNDTFGDSVIFAPLLKRDGVDQSENSHTTNTIGNPTLSTYTNDVDTGDNSFSFDGVDDKFESATTTKNSGTTFSGSLWIKGTGSQTDTYSIIFGTGHCYVPQVNWAIQGGYCAAPTNYVSLMIGDGGAWRCQPFNTSYNYKTETRWTHLSFTYNGGTIRKYQDGQLIGEGSNTISWDPNTNTSIGSDNNNGCSNRDYTGDITETIYYSNVLTDEDIYFQYKKPSVTFGAVQDSPTVVTEFSSVLINAMNTSGSGFIYPGGELAFNESLIQDIEKMRILFNVTDSNGIDTVKIYFTANGSNACSLGNLQSSSCIAHPSFVEWQNNTVTSTFNSTTGTVGDNINCTVGGTSTNQQWTCDIDEHYNPNVWKNYPLDFGTVKWQNGINQRIQQNTWWKININNSIVPQDADIYKIDFRVTGDNSTTTPVQPLNLFLCNSTYGVGDPEINPNCNFVASKLPGDLQDDGSKFRAIIPSSFVSGLGDISYALIGSGVADTSAQYYSMKTYLVGGGQAVVSNISNDDGATYSVLADGYETDFNINWFMNGTGNNISEIVFIISANNTLGNQTNSSENVMSWNIGELENVAPIIDVITPEVDGLYNLSVPINWTIVDVNADSYVLNITLNNATNSTLIANELPNTTTTLNYNVTYWSLGNYNLTFKVCENATSVILCDTHTLNISLGNSPPTSAWVNSSPLTIATVPKTLNFTCTDSQSTPTTGHIYINNTNMSLPNATSTTFGYIFNVTTASTYNVSVRCDDGVFNGSTTDLLLTYTPNCVPVFGGITDYGRYRDNTIPFTLTCSNNVTATSCGYMVNGFSLETFTCNVTNNITLDTGWNTINFSITDVSGTNYYKRTVTTKKLNESGLAGYIKIIIFVVILMFVLSLFYAMKRPTIMTALVVFMMVIIGGYIYAITMWGAFVIWILAILFGVYNMYN